MHNHVVAHPRRKWLMQQGNCLRPALGMLLAPLMVVWIGCVHLIADYDQVTYKSLTDLKAETMLFLEKVNADQPYAEYAAKFDDLQLQLEKVYQYEKGKKLNSDTIGQITEIRTMLQETMDRYKEQNKLSSFYLQEKIKQLETAFDLAISTENSKSRGH